jgi:hypothetical protein
MAIKSVSNSVHRFKRLKHNIKWLADGQDPNIVKKYMNHAPPSVIKGVVNAALNIQKGKGIDLSPKQKKLFSKHRKQFEYLTNRQICLKKKKRLLQKGGLFPFALIAPILSTALSLVGSAFLPKK